MKREPTDFGDKARLSGSTGHFIDDGRKVVRVRRQYDVGLRAKSEAPGHILDAALIGNDDNRRPDCRLTQVVQDLGAGGIRQPWGREV